HQHQQQSCLGWHFFSNLMLGRCMSEDFNTYTSEMVWASKVIWNEMQSESRLSLARCRPTRDNPTLDGVIDWKIGGNQSRLKERPGQLAKSVPFDHCLDRLGQHCTQC